MYCTYCGSKLHVWRLCPRTAEGQSNRKHLRCSFCGEHDHDIYACPRTPQGVLDRVWHPRTVEGHFVLDRRK